MFGCHKNCQEGFCLALQHSNPKPCEWPTDECEDAQDLTEVIASHWQEGATEAQQEAVRCISDATALGINTSMMIDIAVGLNRVAAKADRLLANTTSNLAESWMAKRTKFDGGKRVNRCQKQSWHTRCSIFFRFCARVHYEVDSEVPSLTPALFPSIL